MTALWESRIAHFWETADDSQPEVMLNTMRELIVERSETDPAALYEWASVHDYLGMEHEAVPLYKAALLGGLSGDRKPQAIIQLASSLRNIGKPEEAVHTLREHTADDVTRDAAQAFLALALHDSGRHDEALHTALLALARTLPTYQRAVERYAEALLLEAQCTDPKH